MNALRLLYGLFVLDLRRKFHLQFVFDPLLLLDLPSIVNCQLVLVLCVQLLISVLIKLFKCLVTCDHLFEIGCLMVSGVFDYARSGLEHLVRVKLVFLLSRHESNRRLRFVRCGSCGF